MAKAKKAAPAVAPQQKKEAEKKAKAAQKKKAEVGAPPHVP